MILNELILNIDGFDLYIMDIFDENENYEYDYGILYTSEYQEFEDYKGRNLFYAWLVNNEVKIENVKKIMKIFDKKSEIYVQFYIMIKNLIGDATDDNVVGYG